MTRIGLGNDSSRLSIEEITYMKLRGLRILPSERFWRFNALIIALYHFQQSD